MTDEEPTTTDELRRSYAALLSEEGRSGPTVENATPPAPERIIEALLFVGGEALTAKRTCGIVRGLSVEQFDEAVALLNADYRRQGRPYAIVPHGAGWVLTLRPRHRNVVDQLYGGVREARLSTATVDVLALVAYRQPVTKSEVDSSRGAESGALLRQLVRRGLIQVLPGANVSRKDVAYGTTPRFLETFGLQSLDDLPKTHDLQQL